MERPVKVGKNAPGDVFTVAEYGGGVAENFKEWFKPTPKAVSSRMTVEWQSPYKVMWQNLRDLISPPKLPSLSGSTYRRNGISALSIRATSMASHHRRVGA